MHDANHEMRAKTAVDPLNSCILLVKLKCKRLIVQCAQAWASDCFLTPFGTVEYEEVFKDINCLDFNSLTGIPLVAHICARL